MSKIKLLLDVVSDIRSLADSLEAVADAMSNTQTVIKEPAADGSDSEAKKEAHIESKFTLEDVRGVLAEKSANGHGAEIRELLKKYGQTKLSEIAPKDYAALLADAEVIE